MKNEKYMPKDVCFGETVINAGREGYYSVSASPFIKVFDDKGLVGYLRPNGKCIYPEYIEDTPFYATVSKVVNLTNFMDEDKWNKPISLATINMYLLKYKVIHAFKTKQNKPHFDEQHKSLVNKRNI